MIALALAVLFVAASASARHLQGMDAARLPIKRIWRMALFWPVATAFGAAAAWRLGAPVWAWPAALAPAVWSSLPGAWNVFAVKRLLGIESQPAGEIVQGALGAAAGLLLMVAARN